MSIPLTIEEDIYDETQQASFLRITRLHLAAAGSITSSFPLFFSFDFFLLLLTSLHLL